MGEDIKLRSYQQIFGRKAAKIKTETDLTDFSPGSFLSILLEATSDSDFETEAKLLRILKLKDIDKIDGVDLEALAIELGVSPSRISAGPSSSFVTISDSDFTKVFSSTYAGAQSPVAGDTKLKIVDATDFGVSGTIFIGRDDLSSEKIDYTTKTDQGGFWELALSSPLGKDHLVGEEVVLAQGGDRTISSGTKVRVPPTGATSSINFSIIGNFLLRDGEDEIENIPVIADEPGTKTNVGRNKIIDFESAPFTTALVANHDAATGGKDVETDAELRERIKDHVHNIAKGTERAIIRAVVGVSDDEEKKRVVSAFFREPTEEGGRGILFIDDGTGYEPPFSGIGEETIVTSAIGTEQFFQLQKFSLVKAQVASIAAEPFNLIGGESLIFEIDGEFEERSLPASAFRIPGVVTAQEISEAINEVFTTVEARAKDGQLFVVPTANDPEFIRVGTATLSDDANTVIKFPIRKNFTIRLYKNDVLLNKSGQEAIIQSIPQTQWPVFSSPETLQLEIDGIDSPLISFSDADFAALTSSSTILGATPNDWAIVINSKFIGVTSAARDDGTFTITSNKGKVLGASLEVIAGSLTDRLITNGLSSAAIEADFKLNTFLGQIETTDKLAAGDELKAGTVNTRGFSLSSSQSSFDLSLSDTRNAEMVVVVDKVAEQIAVAQTGPLVFSAPSVDIQRVTGVASQFDRVKADDVAHLYNLVQNGILRVKEVAGDGSYVDFFDPDPQTGTTTTLDGVNEKIQFIRTDGLAQLVSFTVGLAVDATDIVNDFNNQILGLNAEIIDTGQIRIETTRFDSISSLAIMSLAGTAANLGFEENNNQSNDPHIASTESADLLGIGEQRLIIGTEDITSPFVDLVTTGTPFVEKDANSLIYPYLGVERLFKRQTKERLSSSSLTLRNNAPFPTNGMGDDFRGSIMTGPEFGQNDNMVFLIDNDAAKKTFDIPMYVEANISGPSVPAVNEFDLQDEVLDNLGSSDRWSDHRWDDYKIWFKAKNDLPTAVLNTDIRLTAVPFGPNGEKINFGIFYPQSPSAGPLASISVSPTLDRIDVAVVLGSGIERTIGLTPNADVQIGVTGAGPTYNYKVTFLPTVDLSTVLIGDIISLIDAGFNATNIGQFVVDTISNLSDASLSYEHIEDSVANITVGTSTNLTPAIAPTNTVVVGDKIKLVSISKTATAVGPNSITVATGADYATGGGTVVVNAVTYTYTAYAAGVFSGVTPDPDGVVVIGDTVTQTITPVELAITTVTSQTDFDVAGPGYTDGDSYDAILTHKYVTATGFPTFTIVAGDKIQVGGQTLNVDTVIAQDIYDVDTEFGFSGLQSGIMSRINIEGTRIVNGPDETIQAASSQSVRIFELDAATNIANDLISEINNTAGVQDLILASNGGISDGTGVIILNTADELADGDSTIALENGESFILETNTTTSPTFKLKNAVSLVPEIGETIRLIPASPQNIADHFNKKQISGLSITTEVELVDAGRRVQVSSKVAGGLGQVFAVGGRASGNNVLEIRGAGQSFSATRGQVEVDKSSSELLSPGHTVFISQTGRTRKSYIDTTPTDTSTIEIATIVVGEVGRLTFSDKLAEIYAFTHTGTVEWIVRKIGRKRIRFEILSGTSTIPATVKKDDWVLIGDGSSYAGSTPLQIFSSGNQGFFQVRDTDNSTYFDVDNETAVEEIINATSAPLLFASYHSARPGDQIQIGSNAPVVTDNKGSFVITDIVDEFNVDYINANVADESSVALGVGGEDSIKVLDQGYSTYRKVIMISPKPSDPAQKAVVILEGGDDIFLINESQEAKLSLPNRLGFNSDPIPGVSGYQFWTGLKRAAQRTLDGFEPDGTTYPGVRAAGVTIEAREPQKQDIELQIRVKTTEGTTLQAISDTIKNEIVGYINSLGLGQDVVLSKVVEAIEKVPGVDAVVLVAPELVDERITVNDNAVARITSDNIVLS